MPDWRTFKWAKARFVQSPERTARLALIRSLLPIPYGDNRKVAKRLGISPSLLSHDKREIARRDAEQVAHANPKTVAKYLHNATLEEDTEKE